MLVLLLVLLVLLQRSVGSRSASASTMKAEELESRVEGMTTNPGDSRLLSVQQVAEICGVSLATLLKLRRQ